jgi:F-type H+-transporting ATPase subunit delta
MIGEIAAEYRRLVDIYHGVQTADIVTAVPVDEKEKKKLAESLGALVGARITIKDRVDPAIIGGIIARVDGKLLDGSTRSQLAALKRQLVG